MAQNSDPWPVVLTDAGSVTLAPVAALQSRASQWRAWAATAVETAQSLRSQAEERLVSAGSVLVARSGDWKVPTELQATVQQAVVLTDQIAADDHDAAALKAQETSAGFFDRIGVRHHEHEVGQDRSRAAVQLRGMLIAIARSAPPGARAEVEDQREAATDLEAQASALDVEIRSAQGWASACDQEIGRRNDAVKAMGFDSLYEAAVLQTSGARPVDSPLVLKSGEHAYLSVPATLARMVKKSHYIGGSSGFSFPIGHTGIRYRVGAFRGEPVRQESLTKLDTGTLVLTNQRVAYLGQTKSTSVVLSKVMHVEVYDDGLSIAREGKENPDFYLISNPKHAVFLLNWVLAKHDGP